MPETSLATLLDQANTCAAEGAWEKAIEFLSGAEQINPEDPGILTGIGMCYLQLNQPKAALTNFIRAANLAPGSVEAQNNLGIGYTLLDQLDDAERGYKAALALDPEFHPAWKNLAQIYLRQDEKLEEGVQILASVVQNNPHDVEALLLLAACYETGEEYESARTLYERILGEDPDHSEARLSLQRITEIEKDNQIKQDAERIRKLSALKGLRKPGSDAHQPGSNGAGLPPAIQNLKVYPSVSFFGMRELMRTDQINTWANKLAVQGVAVKTSSEVTPENLGDSSFLVFSQPNLSAAYIGAIDACLTAGKKFGIDLDHDYFNLPEDHPSYAHFGKGNARSMQALELMLREAAWVSVSSETLQDRYRAYAKEIQVVLPTWDRNNLAWKRTNPVRETFNIGWIGTPSDQANLGWIKAEISAFAKRHPDVLLVLAGDPGAYQLFPDIAEEQVTYSPQTTVGKDIPFLFNQFDLLLVPRVDTLYNQAESFQFLLYAGAKQVPWLASPIPSFQSWSEGGKIIPGDTGWDAAMEDLYQHPERRESLGKAGYQKAQAH